MTKNDSPADQIAKAFVEARHQAGSLSEYPGLPPTNLAYAYEIQDAAISLEPRPVLGWKVVRIASPYDSMFNAKQLAGPIFKVDFAMNAESRQPILAEGFGAAEAEFVFLIGADANPEKRVWTVEDARGLVKAVHIGMEIASSPYKDIMNEGPAVTISDFGNNFGLLVGPALAKLPGPDIKNIVVKTTVNQIEIARTEAALTLEAAWSSLQFLLELLSKRKIQLRKG